jgi:hypothetical protein
MIELPDFKKGQIIAVKDSPSAIWRFRRFVRFTESGLVVTYNDASVNYTTKWYYCEYR